MPNVHVVVVEQSADGKLFNRGALLNIAFQEYKDTTFYCITHDVDLNPTEDTILHYYCKDVSENAVMGIYTAECNTLGGIIKFQPATILQCNGFPTNFWGWGVEDKALQNRCEYYGIAITKNILCNDPKRDSYFTIFDDIKDKHQSQEFGRRTHIEYGFHRYSREVQGQYIQSSGLNTLSYTVLERKELRPAVTQLVVQISD